MAKQWSAHWIGPAYDPREDFGVFAFRRRFDWDGGELRARVSADNRYRLFCNRQRVGFGPQRGDERHWFYETYDLGPTLREGPNELIALVWNFGRWAPMAQHTVRTAFVLEELGSAGGGVSTPSDWEVARIDGWNFAMVHNGVGEFYIDVGPGEVIDAQAAPLRSIDEGGADLFINPSSLAWRRPHVICTAEDRGALGGGTPWMLVPATLPPQRYALAAQAPVCRSTASGKLLFDFGELLCAYPRVSVRGPAGTELRVTYAESLWIPGSNAKGNRNEVEGKEMRGYQDRFILSGGDDVFEPLWWRTFRFVEIEPQGDPSFPPTQLLDVHLQAMETGYPYEVESSFEADDPWVRPIWDVSVRTAQRCAGETYFDCPYYEQLQYVGDSRIQALIGYYLGRDRRLQRNCIDQIGWSIMESGLTQSRYPSRQTQVIPPFSLWWVMMLYDQMLYDTGLPLSDTRVGNLDALFAGFNDVWDEAAEDTFWNFGDWVPGWRWGVPPGGAHATLHALTYFLARDAYRQLRPGVLPPRDLRGVREEVDRVFMTRQGLVQAAADTAWTASEHAEALWRVFQQQVGWETGPDPWPTEALERANAAKCTYYFSYYKHLAMFSRPDLVDQASDYMDQLQPWKEQIEAGLTTFAENPEPTRSDCHAWSAHPILGFFQIVAGVTSIAPGWKRARIMPHPGRLRRFDARMAHPQGELRVTFEGDRFVVASPVPFDFLWREHQATFEAGTHRIG